MSVSHYNMYISTIIGNVVIDPVYSGDTITKCCGSMLVDNVKHFSRNNAGITVYCTEDKDLSPAMDDPDECFLEKIDLGEFVMFVKHSTISDDSFAEDTDNEW